MVLGVLCAVASVPTVEERRALGVLDSREASTARNLLGALLARPPLRRPSALRYLPSLRRRERNRHYSCRSATSNRVVDRVLATSRHHREAAVPGLTFPFRAERTARISGCNTRAPSPLRMSSVVLGGSL